MKIEHIATWVNDLETFRAFYEHYFGATAGRRYHNSTKNFTFCFLSFDTGCRLELAPAICDNHLIAAFEMVDLIAHGVDVSTVSVD